MATEESLFHAALALAPGPARDAFLAEACASQPTLQAAVEELLRLHEPTGAFLARHTQDLAATNDFIADPGMLIAGRYNLELKLGEGGMGEVWVAKQSEPVKRRVALKLIKPGMDSKAVLQRFEQERQALALMDHPNIAKVLDAGLTSDQRPFFVMELVNGLPLTKYCDEARLTPRQRLELFLPICKAVQHAHHKGIVHRDLKPSNILVTLIDGRPVPKVIDFGVAKATGGKLTDDSLATQFRAIVGTFEYMAPEQAGFSGQDVDTRADLYSLGVILYELLTGLRPFDSGRLKKAAMDEMIRILREEEPPSLAARLSTEGTLPSLAALRQTEPKRLVALMKGELDWIVHRCLEKDRNRRYETANGLARDVERYLHDEPVEARPASAGYRLKKFFRRHRGPVLAVGLVFLALLVGVVGISWGLAWALEAEGRARGERDRADAHAQEANLAKDRALQTAIANRKLYDQSLIERGLEAERKGELFEAMQWFMEPLRTPHLEPNARKMHLVRLQSYLKYGNLPRLVQMLRHGGARANAEVNPGGKLLMTGANPEGAAGMKQRGDSHLGQVQLWDAETGELQRTLRFDNHVRHATLSPDGRRLATASTDHTAQVWDVATGQPVTLPLRHENEVAHVAFGPDGRWLATASWDKTARVWDASTGQPVTGPLRHESPVLHVEFSPDGRRVATASQEYTARVWDVDTGQPVKRPLRHKGTIACVAFSPDGRRVATASADQTARVWDAASGQPVTAPLPHESLVRHVVFSPDGRRLATASYDQTARVWDAATGEPVHKPLGHGATVNQVAFSPDGRWLATASWDMTARVWDLATGELALPCLCHGNDIHAVSFSPDGRLLATASKDHTARVWDLTPAQFQTPPLRHDSPVSSAVLSPDGRKLATEHDDDFVRLWDLASGLPLAPPLRHGNNIACVAFSPDGRRVATASYDMTARVWDATTGQPVTGLLRHEDGASYVTFSPDGRRVATASQDYTARVWDVETGQAVTGRLRHETLVTRVEFSPDGKLLATISIDQTARVWHAATGQLLAGPLRSEDHINHVAFSPDGTRLAMATNANSAQVWDATTGQLVSPPLRHQNSVRYVAFSRDGAWLATASDDGFARVWDWARGQPVTPPLRHQTKVEHVAFSPNGRLLLTHAGGRTQVWELDAGQPVSVSLPSICPGTFTDDGRLRLDRYGDIELAPLDEDHLDDMRSVLLVLRAGKPLDVADSSVAQAEIHGAYSHLRGRHAAFFSPNANSQVWHRERLAQMLGTLDRENLLREWSLPIDWHLNRLAKIDPDHLDLHWLHYLWAVRRELPQEAERHAQAALRRGAPWDAALWVKALYAVHGLRADVLAIVERTELPAAHRAAALVCVDAWGENADQLNELAWKVVAKPGAAPPLLEKARQKPRLPGDWIRLTWMSVTRLPMYSFARASTRQPARPSWPAFANGKAIT